MAGRPLSLCDAKQNEICLLLATGCSLESAARHVGCATATIRRECKRNPRFAERIRHMRRVTEVNPINTMRQAAQSDWRAAAWLLERTQPAQFAKRPANTFSQQEVAKLLARACEVFRRETRDAEKYARIKRRIAELTNHEFAELPIASADPALTLSSETEHAPSTSASGEQPVVDNRNGASTGADEQNWDGEMICMADVKPRHAETCAKSAKAGSAYFVRYPENRPSLKIPTHDRRTTYARRRTKVDGQNSKSSSANRILIDPVQNRSIKTQGESEEKLEDFHSEKGRTANPCPPYPVPCPLTPRRPAASPPRAAPSPA